MTCCGSCCHRDIPRCADVFSLQSPDLLKMTSHPPLALPLGELSAKLTEGEKDFRTVQLFGDIIGEQMVLLINYPFCTMFRNDKKGSLV